MIYISSLSLQGQRILLTRPRHQTGVLEELLRSHGAEPRICPLIQIQFLDQDLRLLRLLQHLSDFDGLIVTSANGVQALALALHKLKQDPPQILADLQLAAVGSQTAAALEQLAGRAVLKPPVSQAEYLADTLIAHHISGQRWLYLKAAAARKVLAQRLRQAGVEVMEQPVYQTLPPDPSDIERLRRWLARGELDILTFTSPSAVKHFVASLPASLCAQAIAQCQIVVIGAVTATAAQHHLGRVDRQAVSASAEGFLTALQEVCHA